jgi:membrane protease YdiL (CAAX protease family)
MILGLLVGALLVVVVAAVRRQPAFASPRPGRTRSPSSAGEVLRPLPRPALAWTVITSAVGVIVVAGFTLVYRHVARPPIIPGLLLYYGCLYGLLFSSCRAFSLRHGSGNLRRDYGLSLRLKDSYRGVGVYLLANIAAGLAIAPFIHQSRLQGTNTQTLTNYRHRPADFIVIALIATLAAPFFEELFFRGLLFHALLGRMHRGWAILTQAAVFGSAHYNPYSGTHNVSVIVAVTAMGLVLGWSAMRFRRLGPGMVAHFLKNVTAVLAILAT